MNGFTFFRRDRIGSFSGRYHDFGVSSTIHGSNLGIGYRAYVTRSGISRSSCDKLYKSSLSRVNGLGRSHMLLYRRGFATQAVPEHKSRKMLYYLTGLVFAMVGLTYASVPLYRRFCQATGYGGTVQRKEVSKSETYFLNVLEVWHGLSYMILVLCRVWKKRLLVIPKMER